MDIAARLIAEPLAKNLVSVRDRQSARRRRNDRYRPVAAAPPDGYTMLVNASSHTSVQALMRNLPYDVTRDFANVTMIAESPLVARHVEIAGHQNVKQLIAAAKAKPGTITFASAGVATTTHIAAEKFRLPPGSSPARAFQEHNGRAERRHDGRIDYLYRRSSPPSAPFATAGSSRSRSVRTGRTCCRTCRRSSKRVCPTPTTACGSASSCPRKHRAISSSGSTVETVKVRRCGYEGTLREIGAQPYPMSVEEFDALVRREIVENERLVKARASRWNEGGRWDTPSHPAHRYPCQELCYPGNM